MVLFKSPLTIIGIIMGFYYQWDILMGFNGIIMGSNHQWDHLNPH